MGAYEDTANRLLKILRLSWDPVAIKFFKEDENPGGLMRRTKRMSFCQFATAAATGGYTLLATPENLGCPNARLAFGFVDPEYDTAAMEKIIESHVGMYSADLEAARRNVLSKPAIPPGEIESVGVAPLAKASFMPDAVLFTVVPAQAYFILDGYMFATGESSMELRAGTNSLTCAYGAVIAGWQHKLNMVTACTGGRIYAGNETNFMQVFVPGEKLDALMSGLEERSKKTSYPGLSVMPAPIPLPNKHILQP